MHHPSRILLAFLVGLLVVGVGVIGTLAQGGDTSTYTVQRGDTLDGIAARFDVQTDCLARINDLDRMRRLRIDQVLIISFECGRYNGFDFVTNPRDDAPRTTAADLSTDLGQGGGQVELGPSDQAYVVQRGDVLDVIAQRFDVSLVSLQIINNLTSPRARIYPGQTLVIPGEAPPYGQFPDLVNPAGAADELGQGGGLDIQPGDQTYIVQPRDVLDLIAASYDVQTRCLATANNLGNPSKIYPGQTLVIRLTCPQYDGNAFVPNPRSS